MNLPEAFGSEYELRRHVEKAAQEEQLLRQITSNFSTIAAICGEINSRASS